MWFVHTNSCSRVTTRCEQAKRPQGTDGGLVSWRTNLMVLTAWKFAKECRPLETLIYQIGAVEWGGGNVGMMVNARHETFGGANQ